MKRGYFCRLLVPILMFAISNGAMAQSGVPFFRSCSYDHLYTNSEAEQAWHEANLGYHPEGIEANIFVTQTSGMKAVYRLSRSVGGHLHHYYTSSLAEKDQLLSVANTGFSFDGIACFVFSTQVSGTVPIYRVDRTYQAAQWFLWWQISPERSADSVLTTRSSEKNYLLSHGYYENTYYGSLIGYAFPGNLGFD